MSSLRRTSPPGASTWTTWTASSTTTCPEENEYYIHRIGRTGRARKKGVAYSILGNFPDRSKLEEIAKYSHFQIQYMQFDAEGRLAPAEVKKAPLRRKYR